MSEPPRLYSPVSIVHDRHAHISYKFRPGGPSALDGIALRGFLLGSAAGMSACLCAAFAFYGGFVQLPLFISALAIFHFLEFYVTARYNTAKADIDAYLLSANGSAYNIAHSTAILEALLEWFFFPSLKANSWATVMGILLVVIGQVVRSLAMAHAASNFNHQVATTHVRGHELVTNGVYRYWRHPSYFGFFWWGLGTQLMLGNPLCFFAYGIVLWRFFSRRISREEEYLFVFFKDDYTKYRNKTRTWIPFI